jgi:hypothetical protein
MMLYSSIRSCPNRVSASSCRPRRTRAGDEQQPVARLVRFGTQRNGVKALGFERDAVVRRNRFQIHRRRFGERVHEWMTAVFAIQREVHDGAGGYAVLGDEQHVGRQTFRHEHRGLADGRVRGEPVDGAPRRFLDVDARQQKLDERELRIGLRPMNRRQGRRDPCHDALSLV